MHSSCWYYFYSKSSTRSQSNSLLNPFRMFMLFSLIKIILFVSSSFSFLGSFSRLWLNRELSIHKANLLSARNPFFSENYASSSSSESSYWFFASVNLPNLEVAQSRINWVFVYFNFYDIIRPFRNYFGLQIGELGNFVGGLFSRGARRVVGFGGRLHKWFQHSITYELFKWYYRLRSHGVVEVMI